MNFSWFTLKVKMTILWKKKYSFIIDLNPLYVFIRVLQCARMFSISILCALWPSKTLINFNGGDLMTLGRNSFNIPYCKLEIQIINLGGVAKPNIIFCSWVIEMVKNNQIDYATFIKKRKFNETYCVIYINNYSHIRKFPMLSIFRSSLTWITI